MFDEHVAALKNREASLGLRRAAVRELVRERDRAADVLPLFVSTLANRAEELRLRLDVTGFLPWIFAWKKELGESCATTLARILADSTDTWDLRLAAARSLSWIARNDRPALVIALRAVRQTLAHPDDPRLLLTLAGIVAQGSTSEPSLSRACGDELTRLLEDRAIDLPTRKAAARAIPIGASTREGGGSLSWVARHKDEDLGLRRTVIFALTKVGPASASCPAIVEVLGRREEPTFLRAAAAKALVRLGKAARPFAASVVAIERDQAEKRKVRALARLVLESMGGV